MPMGFQAAADLGQVCTYRPDNGSDSLSTANFLLILLATRDPQT